MTLSRSDHPLGGAFARDLYAAIGRKPPSLAGEHAVIDLCKAEADLWSDIRKSYRPQINWGKRSLRLLTVNAVKADRVLFECYGHLHARISGVTYPVGYWDVYWREIIAGRGEVILGILDNEMVGGTLIVDGADTAYYASGAYDRAVSKPLAHWPIWKSVLSAKDRGLRTFDLGCVDHPKMTRKERSIAFFKSGFTGGREAWGKKG